MYNELPPSDIGHWEQQIRRFEKTFQSWHSVAGKIVDRYSLKRGDSNLLGGTSEFNILWGNIQTMAPALFSKPPIPSVTRTHKDNDPISRLAAQFLERALATAIESDGLRTVFNQVTQDVLLTGRGACWVRYDADPAEAEATITHDPVGQLAAPASLAIPTNERAPIEYVNWRDFYHAPLRTWKDVEQRGWVARRVFMTRDEGVAKFGDVFKTAPQTARFGDSTEKSHEEDDQLAELSEVFEIWCAKTKKVYFFVKGMSEFLKVIDDPLQLEGFFPCPMPVYGTTDNSTLVPTPDYLQYNALARELDDITTRISALSRALRVRGIYDTSLNGLERLLADHESENLLIGVEGISDYFAKGSTGSSIQGVVQFLPLKDISEALINLYTAREQTKQVVFEVSGLSDVIRGSVDPEKKATATRIKSQFGAARLDKRRTLMDDHIRDSLRIKAEIMIEMFHPDFLRKLGGFDLVHDIAEMKKREPDGILSVIRAWDAVLDLLRDDRRREFTIDVETNSTISVDDNEMLQKRIQMLTAVGGFMKEAFPMAAAMPQTIPAVVEMLLFTIRSFTEGRELESVIEEVGDEMVRGSQEQMQGGGQPSPEEIAAQQQAQEGEIKMQAAQQKAHLEMQLKSLDLQAKQLDLEAKKAMKELEIVSKQEELAMSNAQKRLEIEQRRNDLQVKGEEALLNLAGAEAAAAAKIAGADVKRKEANANAKK